jgi:hypothetical protein
VEEPPGKNSASLVAAELGRVEAGKHRGAHHSAASPAGVPASLSRLGVSGCVDGVRGLHGVPFYYFWRRSAGRGEGDARAKRAKQDAA